MSDKNTIDTRDSATRNAGASAGNKVRGAFEAVHGMGENVRGSTMNALDSVFGRGHPENDEIINRGREEAQRGLENMNRLDDSTTRVTTSQNPSMQNPAYHNTAPSGAATRLVTEPAGGEGLHHHREDAISGIPSEEGRELRRTYQAQPDEYRRYD